MGLISGHVGFVVDKVALKQFFSEHFIFPARSHSTHCSTLNDHPLPALCSFDVDSVFQKPDWVCSRTSRDAVEKRKSLILLWNQILIPLVCRKLSSHEVSSVILVPHFMKHQGNVSSPKTSKSLVGLCRLSCCNGRNGRGWIDGDELLGFWTLFTVLYSGRSPKPQ
jgi:hypothetical protein